MKKTFSFVILVFLLSSAKAQTAGTLDSTFGQNGIISKNIGSAGTEFDKIAIQQNGNIVAAGIDRYFTSSVNVIIYCFHENGTVNENFGSDGAIVLDDSSGLLYLNDLLILPNDKILIAVNKLNSQYFTEEFRLYRFLQNGKPDLLFGNNGVVQITAPGGISIARVLQLQNDKILLLATLSSQSTDGGIVYRFNSDGQPDLSFGKQGRANLIPDNLNSLSQWANTMIVLPDEKFLAGGYAFINSDSYYWVSRYTKNGRLDKTFADEGQFLINLGLNGTALTKLALQPDGNIIGAGHSSNDNDFHLKLFRLFPEGTLDHSFGDDGVETSSFGNVNQIGDLVIQPDGKIVLPVIYATSDTPYFTFHVARFNADGSPDSDWGENGIVTTKINHSSAAMDCALQTDGKLLAAGSMTPYGSNSSLPVIVRYHSGLDLRLINTSEAETKTFIYPNPVNDVASIEYDLNEDAAISIELFSMNGGLIKTFVRSESETAGHHVRTLDISNLVSGNYFVEISANQNLSVVKMIKQ